MPRVCTICAHQEHEAINRQIAEQIPYRSIAEQYGMTSPSVTRHVKECIPKLLQIARNVRQAKSGLAVDQELARIMSRVNKLLDACHHWLLDPEGSNDEYTLEPRGNEINVIYEDLRDLDRRGNPKLKKATLQELLARAEGGSVLVSHTQDRCADPRELILKTASELRGNLEFYAKLQGLLQKERANAFDERERRDWAEEKLREAMENLKTDRFGAGLWLKEQFPDVPEFEQYVM